MCAKRWKKQIYGQGLTRVSILYYEHTVNIKSLIFIRYLDRFCLLRFLHKANNMNTQQRIKKIMAKRTADMMPIFCVKETGGGIISFSTWSLIVSVFVYKIVLPSRSTWVVMHLKVLRCFLLIAVWKHFLTRNHENLFDMTWMDYILNMALYIINLK